ncbi:MAG TPA: Ig-like domain-containing protein [Solimonas sp.]
MIKRQWWLLWAVVLVAGCSDGSVQSPDFTRELQSITVTPAAPSIPLGSTQQFQATGRYTTPPGSPTATVTEPLTTATWASSNPGVVSIDAVSGLATAVAGGTATITASHSGVEGGTVITVIAPDLLEVRIRSIPDTTGPIPLNGSRRYIAEGIYTNSPTPQAINGTVTWTTSNNAIVSVDPVNGSTTTASARAVGNATITASSPNNAGEPITDEVDVTVVLAELNALLRVEPDSATVRVGNKQAFVAIGDFSGSSPDGPIANDQLDWSSSADAVATVDATGEATGVTVGTAVITAKLKDSVPSNSTTQRSADADLEVLAPGADCSAPLRASSGATVSQSISALCVLCDVVDEGNVIDDVVDNFAKINVPVGLLLASASVRVTAPAGPPIPAGQAAGFIVGRPAGTLNPLGPVATAELLSSLTVRTRLAGNVVESSDAESNPLRLALLGFAVIPGGLEDQDQVLVSIPTTQPYDAIELEYSSGLVSAFSETNVFSAVCGTLATTP